jgi:hypothetical protein
MATISDIYCHASVVTVEKTLVNCCCIFISFTHFLYTPAAALPPSFLLLLYIEEVAQ